MIKKNLCLILILMFVILLSLTGCGKNAKKSGVDDEEAESTQKESSNATKSITSSNYGDA